MSGEHTGPAPAEQPAPALNNYKVVCLNGFMVNVASPNDLAMFCKIAKCDGYIASDKLFIAYDAIATIESLGPFVPQQNVMTLPFGTPPKP